ncbi:hypothetical protein PGT21_024611 [Puccinia graminis f. sp. tritici]|uniref:Uncharacterized protein n=1 Tax=Puccinia graminis f. sp. tritici TaxID=56615 RepID=A0A5B0RVZ5_PUCGR|nr:hypothetical protein PGT21_024611 [Puccinia graminis f. sp. tritici]KAA1129033.1 hypothetical protein PGTUg99_025274 [Puccinia graminis f. sp. tritici]
MSSEKIPEKAGIDERHDRSTNQLNTANQTGGIAFANPNPPMSATIQGGRAFALPREPTHDEEELDHASYQEL